MNKKIKTLQKIAIYLTLFTILIVGGKYVYDNFLNKTKLLTETEIIAEKLNLKDNFQQNIIQWLPNNQTLKTTRKDLIYNQENPLNSYLKTNNQFQSSFPRINNSKSINFNLSDEKDILRDLEINLEKKELNLRGVTFPYLKEIINQDPLALPKQWKGYLWKYYIEEKNASFHIAIGKNIENKTILYYSFEAKDKSDYKVWFIHTDQNQ